MLRAILPRPTTSELLRGALRRLPLTLTIVAAILVVTTVTDTATQTITHETLHRWGFDLNDLRHGRLYQLLLTPFQAYRPYMVLTITLSLLLFLGACEYLLGTRRAAIAFWLTHVVGYVGAFALLWPFAAAGYGWADRMTRQPDVGASAAGFGAAGAVIPFLPPFYRRLAFTTLAIYLLSFLVIDRRIWDIEHLFAFPAGLLLGVYFLRRRGEPWPSLVAWPRFSRRQRPAAAGWAVAVIGFVNILSSFVSPRHRGLVWLEDNLSLDMTNTSRHLTLVLGFALVLLALGLARARRQAWLLTVIAVGASGIFHLTKGADLPEALLSFGLLAILIAWRKEFIARTDPPSLRQGYVTVLLLALLLPMYGVLGFYLLRYQFDEVYTVWAAVKETGARMLFANAGEYVAETHRAHWFLNSIPVLGWSGVFFALVVLFRGALAPKRTLSDVEQARRLLAAHGHSGTAYMTLWEGNAVFFGPDRAGYIGYRLAAGVALALGDAIGPGDAQGPTTEAFARYCRGQGWEHAFYAATPRLLPVYERLGYRALKIGEEALIPLPGLEFRGKDWQDVRSALNRAGREGMTFQLYEGGSVPAPVRQQLFAVSADWLAKQELPPMGFTLGTTADVDDPNVYVAVALDREGVVQGFLDWLPMYAAHGWVIDLMRRREGAPPGVMEFLIGSSLLAFKERGYQLASLATAPLANVSPGDAEESTLQQALGFVYKHFDTFYNFQSLFAFKKKFQPRWEGVYLIYRSPAELPRIALAVLRAHMPELGPRLIGELIGSSVVERLAGPRPGAGSPRPAGPQPGRDATERTTT